MEGWRQETDDRVIPARPEVEVPAEGPDRPRRRSLIGMAWFVAFALFLAGLGVGWYAGRGSPTRPVASSTRSTAPIRPAPVQRQPSKQVDGAVDAAAVAR